MSSRFKLFAAVLVMVGLNVPVHAHNGHISTAQPVSDIVIDGDLSDWPADMKSHSISKQIYVCDGSNIEDGFLGRYRVGFDSKLNAIFVAVEIEDDAIVLDALGNEDWNSRDACELFLSMEHSEKKSAPVQFVYRGKPYATFENSPNEQLAKAAKAARATDDSHILYEWRIDLETLYEGDVDLEKGTVIGFDVSFLDRDGDDVYAFYSSSPGKWKHMNASELGDLIIPPANAQIVQLAGRAEWGKSSKRGPELVKIRSVENESLYVQLPLVADGQFMASLPAGEYRLTAADHHGKSSKPHPLTVQKNTLLAEPIRFEVTESKSGKELEQRAAELGLNTESVGSVE